MNKTLICLSLFAALFASCSPGTDTTNAKKESKKILEVTTFKTKSSVDFIDFKSLDKKVEVDFTSKQPGFIKRQSGINEKGEVCVIVYWERMQDAEASMKKFMSDASVADYAQMIDGPTMKMTRFAVNEGFSADNTSFVEVMAFDLKEGTDLDAFATVNKRVGTDFTSKRKGFKQRLMGVNEAGRQIVVVYWSNKADSDASLDAFMADVTAKEFMAKMDQPTMTMGRYSFKAMEVTNTDKVVALLNSFNTGNQAAVGYINPAQYIQHNLSVPDGLAGFGEVMKNAPPSGFKADVVRAYEDGDFVFTHTVYDFFGPKVGFDIFRFEDGLIVEHWDNLIEVKPNNPSGRSQTDGPTAVADLDKTAANKEVVRNFINDVIINHESEKMTIYINPKKYLQHNPSVADGLEGFGAAMKYFAENELVMEYDKLHMLLGQGNFVLSVCEGKFGKGEHSAFYDLFRLEDGQIVEHWDVIAPIPSKSAWKNDNGKF